MPTAKYINCIPEKIRRRKRVGAKRSIIFLGCAVFKICLVHLFNSGLLYHGGTFYLISAFLFSSLSDYFPWGINQNLSERKIKPDHIEYDRVSFIFDARLLITAIINNESYVSWKLDIRFKINPRAVKL